ncbi:siderophore-interacting protein [Aeromicrobium sp. REDSEA-S38_B2]|uniref:siderophore-interacting protein n=1 Tax=Aeromicrobium sp. REDSEA-S38_B2 TaxID=1811528 RepID=UPI000AF1F077|nr:siderophore-interacting protein [Aeromicrobium sp. REDSEA-S38_B2]
MSVSHPAHLTVLDVQDVGPHLRRLVLGDGDVARGFDALAARWSGWADSYVKLVFLADGVTYPDPLDLDEVRTSLPSDVWPVLRTYTVRRLDLEARELWVDVVLHPAIAATLEALPAGARATVFCEVDGPDDELDVHTVADVDLRWLHRGEAAAGTTTLLDDAVRAWPWPEGRVQAFVHGESRLLKTVRPYVRERVARGDLSVSAYWRLGATEEGFRRWKAEQRAVEPG